MSLNRSPLPPASDSVSNLAVGQGLFYALTGMWPLLSMRSFEWVTGPKQDRWLVRTVSILITIIGMVLALAGMRRRVTPEVAFLATGSAMGLAGVDIIYVRQGVIRWVYFLDGIAELGVVAAWLIAWQGRKSG